MSSNITRRSMLAYLGTVTSLLAIGRERAAFAGTAGQEVERLVNKIDELSGALRGQAVSVSEWRSGIDELLSQVSPEELMGAIEFDRLARQAGFADLGVSTAYVRFDANRTRKLNFIAKLFTVDKGRSIIPHGHANMVSAHLPLKGQFRLRQYDQISRDETSLVIRPGTDRIIRAGDLSSIDHEQDNVHWFIAEEPSYTLDLIMVGLDETAANPYEIFNLDIDAAEPIDGETLRVPRIGVEEALQKYG